MGSNPTQDPKNKNIIQTFDIISTSENNFYIKTLNKIFVSTVLKISWIKFKVIPSQDVEGDTL